MAALQGKTALITGASGGLGVAVTRAFLEAGAVVYGTSRKIRQEDFAHPHFHAIPAALDSVQAAQDVVQRLPGVDVVAHLVGGWAGGRPVAAADISELDQMLDINLRSAFFVARAVLPMMRKQGWGCFLAVGSRAAMEPAARNGAYGLAKAALVSLVKTIAIENADANITANIVLPSTMDTPQNRAAMASADFSKWVPPTQVAALLVHLASSEGHSISGAAIPIYGRA